MSKGQKFIKDKKAQGRPISTIKLHEAPFTKQTKKQENSVSKTILVASV
jgi:hypothetical protein